MPIISSVEAKAFRIRAVYLLMYIVLTIGAASMVYPMMLMVSGSLKSAVDVFDMDPIPKYFFDDETLYRKFVESTFNNDIMAFRQIEHSACQSWDQIPLPRKPAHPDLAAAYEAFLAESREPLWQALGHMAGPARLWYMNYPRYHQFVLDQFGGSIDAINRAMDISLDTVRDLDAPNEKEVSSRRYQPPTGEYARVYNEFKLSRPTADRYFVDLDGYYQINYVIPIYQTVEKYNAAHGTHITDLTDVLLETHPPANPAARKDWEHFVRAELNLRFVRLSPAEKPGFEAYLRGKYLTIQALNTRYGTHYHDFSDVPLSPSRPEHGELAADWDFYVTDKAAAESLEIYGPRQGFEAYLASHGYDLAGLDAPSAQAAGFHSAELLRFRANRSRFFRDCLKRNYLVVLDYLVLHGRGVVNTVIYCLLSISTHLLVNPLAAYALSRYKLPSTYKILLFCMATMAFPPAVCMIPNFLLLRELNLLNTFAALILPGMANGYSIFLLKGFFDSLPQELYEAADIDGASEWRKFWMITMALSKPILAVIALGAFTAAYSNFMFALIIVPDQKMWTLMVWLYDLQTNAHQAISYAALCLAAVPTLLVFIFCQNIIMRGIVVPVEK